MKNEKTRKGYEIFVDTLNEFGVEYMFCHTGGAIIPIHVELSKRYEAGLKAPKRIMCRQEPGAGHAAEGYARVSGKPGVALVTSGPAATNLITPIADAYKDSVPTLFFTGQVVSSVVGSDAFQEVPIVEMTYNITKHNFLIKSTDDLERKLREAHHLATTGRPGPVLMDICRNVLDGESNNEDTQKRIPGYNPEINMDPDQADYLLENLLKAKRPVILAGGGVISCDASADLYKFVKNLNIPTALTFMGTGAIPHDDGLFLGMPGMHPTIHANYVLRHADFILSIGARFDDRVVMKRFGKEANIAHVDIDSAEINKVMRTAYPLHADAKQFLEYANKKIKSRQGNNRDWHNQIKTWKKHHEEKLNKGHEMMGTVKGTYIIEQLSKITKGNASVVTGVGQHQMWAVMNYNFQQPRSWVSSGGLGTMGYGLPAAIGAYFANPGRQVILIDGDGSFQMNMQELATVVENNIPLKMFILNNGHLGMVTQWENRFFNGYHEETHLNRQIPNFTNLDKVYPGLKTKTIYSNEEASMVIEKALSDDSPYLVNVMIGDHDEVLPMTPPGKGLEDMLF